MISRKRLFGKLGLTAFRSIESAAAFCKLRGNPHIELVHWLHQIFQLPDSDLLRIARHFDISAETIDRELTQGLAMLPSGATSISNFSPHVETAIERAWIVATLVYGEPRIRTAHLLSALLQTTELRAVLLAACPSLQAVPERQLPDILPALLAGSPEENELAHDGSGLAEAAPGEASGATGQPSDNGSALRRYCTDLTELARTGRIDPVIGREQEIRTMTDILLRRRQNNPLLTGEAGVGKTAVVEGLAIAIADKTVPPALHDVRLLSLDVGALLAGASMKGEFESRLKAVLEEAGKSPSPVILFVDEVHTLVGAGGNAGTGDAANLLKPALARGGLRTIGATTWSEYKRHIEKDAALTRRFQVLQVHEPDEEQAINMVRGLSAAFEKHHGVLILDDAIRAAVTLSSRYIPSRQLPDKAISLLDTACARVALSTHAPPGRLQLLRRDRDAALVEQSLLAKQNRFGRGDDKAFAAIGNTLVELEAEILALENRWQAERELVLALVEARHQHLAHPEGEPIPETLPALHSLEQRLAELQGDAPLVHPEVNAAAVATIVSEWTGIPVGRMVKDELAAVLDLPGQLGQRVIGQTDALISIAERIQVARSGMADPGKPIGVFLLVGPSGIGKTETALALAEALYGGEQNLITVNMSEFQEAHTVSTLKGAPPGYVGYGEGGVLTEAVRRRPYSVVLLDEIEKAHRDVHEIFYQVFDKGFMEDGEGRLIDFKNTVILLTSNVGSELLAERCSDPTRIPDADALAHALRQELLRAFPAAFLGRLQTVPYLPLPASVLGDIIRLQLGRVQRRMTEQHDVGLDIADAVVDHIVGACQVAESGARLLISHIEQHILPLLGRIWLENLAGGRGIERIELDISDGKLVHRTIPAADVLPLTVQP
ncbi:type VI secretion system ATPase TssH [Azonexus sp.]|uniref:type VI secretion system ATPase TssH n=1 Tax=Azonexus sp. TaxID=1872668 RepID=UPI002818A89C|nr:type VI secretion system ATPase TssH [Azonexus sp.]MDR1996505.1 type VI secretion system ATPase TssH [Azonexus sp.]